jgi:hypothetical protein
LAETLEVISIGERRERALGVCIHFLGICDILEKCCGAGFEIERENLARSWSSSVEWWVAVMVVEVAENSGAVCQVV